MSYLLANEKKMWVIVSYAGLTLDLLRNSTSAGDLDNDAVLESVTELEYVAVRGEASPSNPSHKRVSKEVYSLNGYDTKPSINLLHQIQVKLLRKFKIFTLFYPETISTRIKIIILLRFCTQNLIKINIW